MSALLIFCAQNAYLDPMGSVYMGEKAEIFKIRLLDYLSSFSEKVIFFREKRSETDNFFTGDRTHSIVNTPDFHIHEKFKRYSSVVYDKIRYSGLYETGFSDYLKQNHIKSVILTGLETHTSILFSAEELRNRGIKVTLIEPLIMSRDEYMHYAAISLMVNYLGVELGV